MNEVHAGGGKSSQCEFAPAPPETIECNDGPLTIAA